MNNATLASVSNVPLFPTCFYISAFSTLFISKNLMTINERNQSVSVINILFGYLNKFENESLAKSQLLAEVLTKANINPKNWNRTLDMKYVNDMFQYIITASILHPCDNIIGYLSGHASRQESITFSSFRDFMRKALTDKCINNNPCSKRNGSAKLTPLAIEKLLEYIWIYDQERISREMPNDVKKEEVTKFQRFRRQPPIYADNLHGTDSEFEEGIESIINFQQDTFFDFPVEQRETLFAFLQAPENDTYTINTHDEDVSNQFEVCGFLLDTSAENRKRSQQDAVENLSDVIMASGTKVRRIDAETSSSSINKDLINSGKDLDNNPSTSKKVTLSFLKQILNEQKKQESNESFTIRDEGKSKRMLSIEVAASFICDRVPIYDFSEIVDMLKGFLLKLEDDPTLVPTYNHLAQDFYDTAEIPSSYEEWKIPKHEFIDDVLFKSYFGDIDVIEKETCKKWLFLRQYPVNLFENDLKMYQNSIKLQKSLQFRDFVFLRFHLLHSTEEKVHKKQSTLKQITATVYRLALRECEEDWIDTKIKLYAIDFDKKLSDLRTNSTARRDYTFKKYIEFSANLSKEIGKLEKFSVKVTNLVLFTIELENQAGVINIDRLFGENTSGRYMVPINVSFAITQAESIKINKYKVFSIKMRDDRIKEKKMIEMVENLVKYFNITEENV